MGPRASALRVDQGRASDSVRAADDLNKDYIYPGDDYDLKRLFKFRASIIVHKRRGEVVSALRQMRKMLMANLRQHCDGTSRSPLPVRLLRSLPPRRPERSISQLPRLGAGQRQFATMGIVEIAQIPEGFKGLSTLQARVVEAVRTQTRFHDPALSRRLQKLKYPIHFLDFETFNPALPLYPRTRPYQIIPFQWSDHILNAEGGVAYQEFLHGDRTDPRRRFAETLLQVLGTRGSIVVYSHFEDTRLQDLGETFRDLAPSLERVRSRIVDLLPLIKEHVYDPGFGGSFSLKSVLSTIVPELGYDDLEISDGASASFAYAEMQASETTEERRAKVRARLLAYCKRDTEALLQIFGALR